MSTTGPNIEQDLIDFEMAVCPDRPPAVETLEVDHVRSCVNQWDGPTIYADDVVRPLLALRMKLIEEEYHELMEELERGCLAGIAKESCDVIYVVMGTLVRLGIPFQPVWNAVHNSNLLKAGGPRRADGKILKPDGYVKPEWKIAKMAFGWLRKKS